MEISRFRYVYHRHASLTMFVESGSHTDIEPFMGNAVFCEKAVELIVKSIEGIQLAYVFVRDSGIPSIGWVFQLLFTGASAVYQFAVLGTRLFFPLGIVLFFAASLLVARLSR